MAKRLIIYGDIHGCLEEFKLLRKKIKPKKGDIEVVVGDILNKGPFSVETLKYIIKKGILAVMGNNEFKFINLFEGNSKGYDLKPREKKLLKKLKKKHIKFLKKLPYFLKFDNITIVHGGIPYWLRLDKKLSEEDKWHLISLRFYDKDLKILPWSKRDKLYKYWAQIYDGKEGFVVYGHQPFKKPKIDKFAIGIDTGCVYGGKLSAVIFKWKKDGFDINNYKIVSIKARKNYFK